EDSISDATNDDRAEHSCLPPRDGLAARLRALGQEGGAGDCAADPQRERLLVGRHGASIAALGDLPDARSVDPPASWRVTFDHDASSDFAAPEVLHADREALQEVEIPPQGTPQ